MNAMTLAARVDSALAEAFSDLGLPLEFAKSSPSKPEHADRQCNGAMPAAKKLGRDPRDVAAAIAANLAARPEFASVSVAGPGFVNLRVSPALLAEVAMAQAADPALGVPAGPGKKVVIDFGGPNVAKPLHVGHLRSLVIGESLRRILSFAGNRVVSDIHLGDWGLQMGQLISAVEIREPSLPYFDPAFSGPYPGKPPVTLADLEALYPEASAACKADPARRVAAQQATAELQAGRPGYVALWRHFRELSLAAQSRDIAALDAHFDLFLGESDSHPFIGGMVEDLKARGIAVEDGGALVVHVAEPADGERPMPPLILLKSDGAVMYGTTDLATLAERVSGADPADQVLYVVDQRQADHLQQVFRAAAKAGISADCVHVSFGTVNGKDGKPYKTRDGGVAKLADLIADAMAKAEERVAASSHVADFPDAEKGELAKSVAIAALKFADLSSNRRSGYVFDPEKLVAFEGKTGPFVQYACVRIGSILAKAGERGLAPGVIRVGKDSERDLLVECQRFPEVVASAAANLLPSEVAEFAFGLAQRFGRFYADCPVLGEEDDAVRASRLAICGNAHAVLSKCLWLLGIRVPGRM